MLVLGLQRVVLGQKVKDTNFVRIVCVIELRKSIDEIPNMARLTTFEPSVSPDMVQLQLHRQRKPDSRYFIDIISLHQVSLTHGRI